MKKIFLIFIIFLITSCTSSEHYAPVVNGWAQRTSAKSYYVVQKNDTIYSIAWAFGLDYRDLAQINHLSHYRIRAGQRLRMKPKASRHKLKSIQRHRKQIKHTKVDKKPIIAVKSWYWPAYGKIVERYSPHLGRNRGINIAGQLGEPIRATAKGVIVYSGSGVRGYGKLIIIKHSDSFLSAYAYNKHLLVKEGQQVKAGQKIAEMGRNNAGRVLLHFEIRRNGKSVNPLRYLT